MKIKYTILTILSFVFLSSFLQIKDMKIVAFSGEANELNVQVQIAYDDQMQKAKLSLDVSDLDEDIYQIEEVRVMPLEKKLTQAPYEISVLENGTYTYEIIYHKLPTSDVATETIDSEILRLDYVIDKLHSNSSFSAMDEANMEIQTPGTPTLFQDKQTFDADKSIDMSKAFEISGYSTRVTPSISVSEYDADHFIKVEKNKVTAGNKEYANSVNRMWQTMHLKSKFNVDFTRSFEIVGAGRTPSTNPDGVSFGFYNDENFSLMRGFYYSGGALGVYTVYPNDAEYGAHNAIVYEIDTYRNDGWEESHLLDRSVSGNHAALITVNESGKLAVQSMKEVGDTLLNQEQTYKITYDSIRDVLNVSWTDDATYHYELVNPKQYLKSDYASFYMSGSVNQSPNFGTGGSLSLSFHEFKYTDIDYQADIIITTKKGNEDVPYKEGDETTYPKPGEEITVKHAIYNKLYEISNKQTPIRFSKVAIGDTPLIPYDLKAYGEDGEEVVLDESDIFNGSELGNGMYKTTLIDIPMHSEKLYVEYKLKLDEHYQGNESITNEVFLGAEGMEQFDFSSLTKALGLPTLKSNQSQYTSISTESSLMTNEEILKDIVGHVYDHQESMAIDTFIHGDFFCKLEDMNGNIITQIDKGQYGVYKQSCTLSDQRYDLTSPEMIRHIYVSDIYQESDSIQISAHGVSVAMTELKQHGNDLEAWIKQKTGVVATIKGERMDIAAIQVNLQDFHVDASYDNSPYIIKFQADDMEHGTSAIIEVPIEVVSGIDLTVENIIINQAELQAHESDVSTYLLQLANVSAKIGDEPLTDYLTYLNLKEFNAFVEASETPYELEVIVTTQSTQITEKATLLVSVTPNVYSYLSIPSRIELFEDQGYVDGSYDEQFAGAIVSIQYQGNVYTNQVKITIPNSVTLYPEDRKGKDIYIAQLYDLSGNSLIEQGANEVEIVNATGADQFDVQFRLNTKKAMDRRQTHYTGILGFHIEMSTR